MPSPAPGPDPAAPSPEPRPPVPAERELWTRPSSQLAASHRRRRDAAEVWNTLILLLAGGVAGFFGGVLYEKTSGPAASPGVAVAPVPGPLAAAGTPEPDVPLPPSPPVGQAAVAARLERIKARQPDVGDILKYARELRRVATIPAADVAAFPSDAQVARLLARFAWRDPVSPDFHRTPLLLVLGYSPGRPDAPDQADSAQAAGVLAQTLVNHGITSPIYTCGMGSADGVPEVETAGNGEGRFVEVWVAFTLF